MTATVVAGFQESLAAPTFLAEGQHRGISSPEGHLRRVQPHSSLLNLCTGGGRGRMGWGTIRDTQLEGASQQAEA